MHDGVGEPVPITGPHWYMVVYHDGCVLCGVGEETERIRIAGQRPDDPAQRYRYEGGQWACPGHFM